MKHACKAMHVMLVEMHRMMASFMHARPMCIAHNVIDLYEKSALHERFERAMSSSYLFTINRTFVTGSGRGGGDT